jgi:CDP-glycerol glycerophosphotransferase (TagB/SpsB family)
MINFVHDASANYAGVQQSLLNTVRAHLPQNSHTSSTSIYREGSLNFALFVRQPADVVMSHGVADKNYFTDVRDSNGQLYANRLNGLLVPGPWMKRKLLAVEELRLTENQIHTVGWPRLDELRRLRPAKRAPGRLRLLWAPTHDFVKRGDEKRSTSTFPEFVECLKPLQRHFDIAVSVHPRNRALKTPTSHDLLAADVVISDFGTMVYEAWALGKPVVFPRWILGDRIQKYLPGSAEAYIFEKRLGYHPESLDELTQSVSDGATVSPEVDGFMTDYLDNYKEGVSGKRIAELLTALSSDHA